MKNLSRLLFIFFTVLFAACSGKETTDNAQLEADVSPVLPKINSTVTKIFVDDNQVVKEGDTLVLLDDATYKIAVQQAQIAVELAKQNVVSSKSSRNTAASTIASASANSNAVAANITAATAGIDAAKAKVELDSKNYERFKNLLEQKSATLQQFDGAKAEKEASEAQLRIAQSQLASVSKQIEAAKFEVSTTRSTVATSDNSIGLAKLSVKQAEINLDAAKLQLSYCAITAPANGIVSKKNVQKGQVVAIGQPLMAIAGNQQIWIVANFKETQVEKMQEGQQAEITVDAYSDKTFNGKVQSFSQATGSKFSLLPADNATGNFVKVTQRLPVKILITDSNDARWPLRAGMSVTVKVKTK